MLYWKFQSEVLNFEPTVVRRKRTRGPVEMFPNPPGQLVFKTGKYPMISQLSVETRLNSQRSGSSLAGLLIDGTNTATWAHQELGQQTSSDQMSKHEP